MGRKEPLVLKGIPLFLYVGGMIGALIGVGRMVDNKFERLERRRLEQIAQTAEVQEAPQVQGIAQQVLQDIENYEVVEVAPVEAEVVEETKPKYSAEELEETRNILYAESANQPRQSRRLIGKVILNRVAHKRYPNTIKGVIYQPYAFSCINDSKNPNWKQATGKSARNEYEERVFGKCGQDAKQVLDGKKEGIKREDEIIAYHDTSISIDKLRSWETKAEKRKADYWKSLEEVYRTDRLIFYAPKAKNSSK